MSKKNRGSLVVGIILILIGIVIISDRFTDFFFHYYLGWDVIIPAVFTIFGLFLLIKGFTNEKRRGVFSGTLFLVLGVYFFLRNSYLVPVLDWYTCWPVFFIAPGLGFLVLFLSKPKNFGPLIPAVILLFIGGGFLAEEWGFCYFDFEDIIGDYWPVIIILIGLKILIGGIRKKSENNQPVS